MRPHVVVQLFAGEVWGLGEATPLAEFTGETAAGVRDALDRVLLPLLPGRDPRGLAEICALMDAALPGHPSAKAAIDGALLDVAGKLMGAPACHLLGGSCAARLPFARTIGIAEAAEALAEARALAAAGAGTLKIKVGSGDPDADVERVRTVRRALGPAVRLRIDGNEGLDFSTARRMLLALRECDLLYAEQPLPRADVEGAAALRRETGVPLAADEGVGGMRDAAEILRRGAADVLVLKPVTMAGVWRARQVAALAEAHGIGCVVSSAFDTQVGGSACVQLARSLPNAPYAHELTVFPSQPEMARTCHRVEPGAVIAGDEPGLGISWITELADVLAARSSELRA